MALDRLAMKPRGRPALMALLGAWASLAAFAAEPLELGISDAETRDPPTAARLKSIAEASDAVSWNGVVIPVRNAALKAYGQGRFVAADAWFHAYRWTVLFSEPENIFIPGWCNAIMAAHANYAGMDGKYEMSDKPIGLNLSRSLEAWLLGHEAFSKEFFTTIKDVDNLPKVFSILDRIYRDDPGHFERYQSLALAIAVVYDVPPPPFWPHGQVTPEALPRRLPDPLDAFRRLVREDAEGHTFMRLDRLRAEELKFVVDAAAPASELDWSQQKVSLTQDSLENSYFMVNYRSDRLASYATLVWSGTPYTLQAILKNGGICVDQAYFATEVGKARGVPTLLFTGEGQDGRHAWFGYLDAQREWRLDAGRYAEQRLVTGRALDPQTWTTISDHELQFLSERFRALPSYAESRVHQEFAEDFLRVGDARSAAHAARVAVDYERRNTDAWEALIAADEKLGLEPAKREAVLREAALAFTPRYPDLAAAYVNRVCESLRARGETSLANFEESGLAARLKGDRNDLAVAQASAILARSLASQSVDDQIGTYNAILAQFGHGSGVQFFDQIVVAFAEHLIGLHMKAEARQAVERAREALEVQPGTPFAMDVDKLMLRLQD